MLQAGTTHASQPFEQRAARPVQPDGRVARGDTQPLCSPGHRLVIQIDQPKDLGVSRVQRRHDVVNAGADLGQERSVVRRRRRHLSGQARHEPGARLSAAKGVDHEVPQHGVEPRDDALSRRSDCRFSTRTSRACCRTSSASARWPRRPSRNVSSRALPCSRRSTISRVSSSGIAVRGAHGRADLIDGAPRLSSATDRCRTGFVFARRVIEGGVAARRAEVEGAAAMRRVWCPHLVHRHPADDVSCPENQSTPATVTTRSSPRQRANHRRNPDAGNESGSALRCPAEKGPRVMA